MAKQLIDQFAAALPSDKRTSVYQSTKATHEKRTKMLFDQFAEPNRLRSLAGGIKQHVLELQFGLCIQCAEWLVHQ